MAEEWHESEGNAIIPREAGTFDARKVDIRHIDSDASGKTPEVDGAGPGFEGVAFTNGKRDTEHYETRRRNFDYNLYATKKSAAEGLLDLALLMANASQLKQILMTEGNHRFYYPMLVFLVFSIVLQVAIGICLLVLGRIRVDPRMDEDIEAVDGVDGVGRNVKNQKLADNLNNWTIAGIFVLTVINIFISAFGLSEPSSPNKIPQ